MKKEYILYWNEQPIGKGPSLERLIDNANQCKYYDQYTGQTENSVYKVTAAESTESLYTI